jgi:hypothetical protein
MLVVSGALGFHALEQDRRITQLSEKLAALEGGHDEHAAEPEGIAVIESDPRALDGRALDEVAGGVLARAALRARAAEGQPAEPKLAEPAPAPRAVVGADEIARVESALLTLLESDRPELNAKLRSVVQDEHAAIQQEQREQRRERWITRTEARLLELGKSAGLNAEQSGSLLQILLASRDQMSDVWQSAQTPEAMAQVREKVAGLREQRDQEIRGLLSETQYKAYEEQMQDDDNERGARGRARARNSE